jgi:hypothetical protein
MSTLREFVDVVDRKVTAIFHATGVVYPMWHAVTQGGEHRIVVTPAEDKDTAAILMRAYFMLHNVARYVFVSEAWQAFLPNDDVSKIREIAKHGLSDHPGRIEVLMFQAEDLIEPSFTAHRLITRLPDGKIALGPLEFVESMQSEGRFVGMLPQQGMTQ